MHDGPSNTYVGPWTPVDGVGHLPRWPTPTKLKKPIKVHLGDASVIPVINQGTIHYLMETSLGIVPVLIPNALRVWAHGLPPLCCLLHWPWQHDILFDNDNCFIHSKPSGKCVASAHKTSGSLYCLIAHPMTSKEYANTAITSHHLDINLPHCCLGHLSYDNVKWLVDKGMVDGVTSVGGHIEFCEACVHGKQHRLPFPPSNKHARQKLDLIHSDVCGPLPISIGGKRYFITFIDDRTSKGWIYFMAKKSEAYTMFR